ncbi:MAG: accessory factor UbiK family protein [Burkholderiaceae bacterium]|jgi:BMFP domain-containing protein YqiC|nr:accessory factor UbiK family protein [Burkholderiaceae bacterium]MEB2352594.1 accessory factor UbiK family protein [Burkholderiaceae bacterium]
MNATPPPPASLLADLQARLGELLRSSPAADIERNVKALLAQAFQRADLVTREEFDAQLERLTKLQQRVEQLEQLLAERSPGA